MLKLPRLPLGYAKVPGLFEKYWDEVLRSIERAVNTADTSSSNTSLLVSFVKSTTNIISADSLGVVTILDHTRVYGDGTEVSVGGGTLVSSSPPGTIIRIYYLDSTRSGGLVAYQFTHDLNNKPIQKDSVHYVGSVVIPVAGTALGASLDPLGSIYL